MSYIRQGVRALNHIGMASRHLQTQAYKGGKFARRVGETAKEFNGTRLGHILAERSAIGGRIARGVQIHAPHIATGLDRAGDILGKIKELENVNLDRNKVV